MPPPDEQPDGMVAKLPVSPMAWNGIAATFSPAIEKSAVRTEPNA